MKLNFLENRKFLRISLVVKSFKLTVFFIKIMDLNFIFFVFIRKFVGLVISKFKSKFFNSIL